MTEEEKRITLARYRLRQSQESLEEARFLFEGEKSLRSVVNRAYYAMFYAVLALLIFEPYSSSKHSGVLSYFHRRFIKEEVFPENLGKSLQKAFEIRNAGDYQELADPTAEETVLLLEEAKIFVYEIRLFLKNSQGV